MRLVSLFFLLLFLSSDTFGANRICTQFVGKAGAALRTISYDRNEIISWLVDVTLNSKDRGFDFTRNSIHYGNFPKIVGDGKYGEGQPLGHLAVFDGYVDLYRTLRDAITKDERFKEKWKPVELNRLLDDLDFRIVKTDPDRQAAEKLRKEIQARRKLETLNLALEIYDRENRVPSAKELGELTRIGRLTLFYQSKSGPVDDTYVFDSYDEFTAQFYRILPFTGFGPF